MKTLEQIEKNIRNAKKIIEMVVCARIYIRNKARTLNVPRFNEVNPIQREYAILGEI